MLLNGSKKFNVKIASVKCLQLNKREWLGKWNDALKSPKGEITKSAFICINHFDQNDLVGTGIGIKLKDLAVPFTFYYNRH